MSLDLFDHELPNIVCPTSEDDLDFGCDSGDISQNEVVILGGIDGEIDWEALMVALEPTAPREATVESYETIKSSVAASRASRRSASPSDISDSSNSSTGGTGSRRKNKRSYGMEGDPEHEDDETKIMRIGSLGRIIASGHAVLDNAPSLKSGGGDGPQNRRRVTKANAQGGSSSSASSTTASSGNPSSPTLKAGAAFSKIVNAFNMCDLDSLSKLVRAQCHKDCELHSNVLSSVIRGRKYVMMFWALQMEMFPDAIWVCSKSTAKGMTITREFKFSGTRVFRRSTNDLYEHVRRQALQFLDPSKSSYGIDELSTILESCWVSPTSPTNASSGAASRASAGGGGMNSFPSSMVSQMMIPQSSLYTLPAPLSYPAIPAIPVEYSSPLCPSPTNSMASVPPSLPSPAPAPTPAPAPAPAPMSLSATASMTATSVFSSFTSFVSPMMPSLSLPYSSTLSLSTASNSTLGSTSSTASSAASGVPLEPHVVVSSTTSSSTSSSSRLFPHTHASFSSANVLALAMREQGNVVNIDKELVFTFNSSHQIIRIDSFGDL